MPNFFLIVSPGFEDVAERELRAWLSVSGEPTPTISKEKGGISLEVPLEIGFALNRVLKTPSRILLRLADFGCRDFPKLFRKSKGLAWGDWVFPGAPPLDVSASSHSSRLAVKKRIADVVSDGFKAWKKQQPQLGSLTNSAGPATELQSVFVRFVDDVCTISLDTSGAHLHKRGYRIDTPEAPLRETFAAGLLIRLFEGAGQGRWNLIDPMAGSGTFLFEALGLAHSLPRSFAFENFACVREKRVLVKNDWPSPAGLPQFEKVTGFDASEEALRAARSNAERIGHQLQIGNIELIKQDIFSASAGAISGADSGDVAVICNPPYGERLKIEGPLTKYYSELLIAVDRGFKPRRAGFVFPAKADPKRIEIPRGWRRDSVLRFSNGGLPVVFDVFARD